MKVRIKLNGTDTNPFHRYGLTQNPFPQIARAEYAGVDRVLNDLGARPIKDTDDIRERLRGLSPEFVELCCKQFVPGQMVKFEIEFPGD